MSKKQSLFIGIAIMFVSALCVCFGQMLWKMSGGEINAYMFFGFLLYGIGALAMFMAYKFGEVSRLQPVLCINYPLTVIIAHFVFAEQITVFRILGIVVITIGVFLIAVGGKHK